jgi:dienelactone hydrolase
MSERLLALVSFLGFCLLPSALAEVQPIRGLSRDELLQIAHGLGSVSRAGSPQEWEVRKREALAGFQQVAGLLPVEEKRCELGLSIEEEVDCGTYLRRLVTYSSSPGGRVPAYLCVPKAALAGRPAPAVLCLHPTDDVVGHGVVVGLGGKPNRQYASELAEQGFVTLSPSYPLLAKYQPDLDELGFTSGTMKAVWDNIRGLDLLESFSFVRKEAGFATIGHSLGGHNSIFTAVFEPRLRVVVSSCGFDSFLDYYGGNIRGWVQKRYMLKMGDYLGKPEMVPFDFYELVATLAPRALLVNAPTGDANFSWNSVDRIVQAAKAVYALHRADTRIEVLHPDCKHDFPDEARAAAYKLIRETLGTP